MGVPVKRLTKSKSRKRQTGKGLKKTNLVKCKKCNTAKLPHVVCPNCGSYKGKEVVDKSKVLKRLAKKKKS